MVGGEQVVDLRTETLDDRVELHQQRLLSAADTDRHVVDHGEEGEVDLRRDRLETKRRVLPRRDEFGRFVSVLVYIPRDRYDSDARVAIGDYLARVFKGHVSAFYPYFPEGPNVRVLFIIGRRDGETLPVPPVSVLAEAERA